MKSFKCFKCGSDMELTLGERKLVKFTEKDMPKTKDELAMINQKYPGLLAYGINAYGKKIADMDPKNPEDRPIGVFKTEGTFLKCKNTNCGHIWKPKDINPK